MRRLTLIAMMLSIGIVFSILESFIPTIVIGAKLGLANIVTLIVLYYFSYKEALVVVILRVLIVGLLLGTIGSYVFFMSLSGGLLAYLSMVLIKKIKIFSIVSVSVIGALMHSIGQIIIVMIIISYESIIYLPIMLVVSIVTGMIVGVASKYILTIFNVKENVFEIDNNKI